MEFFNKEDVYDNEISPLMTQIIDICKQHGIPIIASFTYENSDERDPGRCTTLINNIPDRHDNDFRIAANQIIHPETESFAISISKSGDTE